MRSDSRFTAWRKSSRSDGGQNCVEVARAAGVVGVRDSKDSAGPTLAYRSAAWGAFVAGIDALRPID